MDLGPLVPRGAATRLPGPPPSKQVQAPAQPVPPPTPMMGDTLVDSYLLLWRILLNFAYGRGLYINELMAKKFSLLGCVALMIACTLARPACPSAGVGQSRHFLVPSCGERRPRDVGPEGPRAHIFTIAVRPTRHSAPAIPPA